MSQYYTYAIGTRKGNSVYLLYDLDKETLQRIWTKKPSKAMAFYTEEEVQFVIRKFEIPDAAVARIKHKV
jgi:hypothetical protein